jgi:hypothetical protein
VSTGNVSVGTGEGGSVGSCEGAWVAVEDDDKVGEDGLVSAGGS